MAPVPLWLLALITFSGTLAMHVFIPALPEAGADLGAEPAVIRATVSIYILGLAFGQLIYGPLSDHFGRRPVLMGGLVLYTLAGFAAALAPDVQTLIIARLLQALGGCSGLVLGRAIVRDTSTLKESGRRLAVLNLFVTIGPGGAPILGSLLVSSLGWRSVLAFLCLFGMANMLFAWRLLHETAKPGQGTSISMLASHYLNLIRSPRFLGFAFGGGCATTSVYAFIATAPFIFVQQLSRPIEETGVYIGMLISGVWLGSMVTTRLIVRMRIERLLVLGNMISALAAFAFLGVVLADSLSVVTTVVSLFFFTFGVGISSPSAQTLAVSVNTRIIGSASGLYGFAQMIVGALCTSLASIGDNPALAAGIVMSATGILAQLSFLLATRWPAQE